MEKFFSKMQDVLVRGAYTNVWKHGFYDRFDDIAGVHNVIVRDENGYSDDEIVPYNEETAFLEGTTTPYYSWNPVPGTCIAVRDNRNSGWSARVFIERQYSSFVCVPHGIDWESYKSGEVTRTESWNYGEPFKNHFQVEE